MPRDPGGPHTDPLPRQHREGVLRRSAARDPRPLLRRPVRSGARHRGARAARPQVRVALSPRSGVGTPAPAHSEANASSCTHASEVPSPLVAESISIRCIQLLALRQRPRSLGNLTSNLATEKHTGCGVFQPRNPQSPVRTRGGLTAKSPRNRGDFSGHARARAEISATADEVAVRAVWGNSSLR